MEVTDQQTNETVMTNGAKPNRLQSICGLLGSMFGGFVVGWLLCVLIGPQGLGLIAILCAFTVIGAISWSCRSNKPRGCGLAVTTVVVTYVLLVLLQATIGF